MNPPLFSVIFLLVGVFVPANSLLAQHASDAVAAQSLAKDIVPISFRLDGEDFGAMGVVIAIWQNQALIAAPVPYAVRNELTQSDLFYKQLACFIWLEDSHGRRRPFEAKRLTSIEGRNVCVLAMPAEKLPPPLKAQAAVTLEENMPLLIAGYEGYSRPHRSTVFSPIAARAIVSSMTPDSSGAIAFRCAEAPSLSTVVVTSESGEVVGVSWGGRPDVFGLERKSRSEEYALIRLEQLQELLKPELVTMRFGFPSGNSNELLHEFVAVIDDPLNRVRSPQIHIQSTHPVPPPDLDEQQVRTFKWPGAEPPDGKWPLMLSEPITLDLQRKLPTPTVRLQQPWLASASDFSTFVAQHRTAHPGQVREHVFFAQASYLAEDGERRYEEPKQLSLRLRKPHPSQPSRIPKFLFKD